MEENAEERDDETEGTEEVLGEREEDQVIESALADTQAPIPSGSGTSHTLAQEAQVDEVEQVEQVTQLLSQVQAGPSLPPTRPSDRRGEKRRRQDEGSIMIVLKKNKSRTCKCSLL